MLVLLPTLILLAAVVAVLLRIFVIDKLQIKNVEDKVVLVTGSAGAMEKVSRRLSKTIKAFNGCSSLPFTKFNYASYERLDYGGIKNKDANAIAGDVE
ncbi:unnamed protein product [Toxocara canis]|uniref:Alba domain-containing protein n=1 Tax=Toxocara canis TaxID=6265 RepID=A0A183UWQ3_TOXCA|nr:unnamed protein product [Toxocara canis]